MKTKEQTDSIPLFPFCKSDRHFVVSKTLPFYVQQTLPWRLHHHPSSNPTQTVGQTLKTLQNPKKNPNKAFVKTIWKLPHLFSVISIPFFVKFCSIYFLRLSRLSTNETKQKKITSTQAPTQSDPKRHNFIEIFLFSSPLPPKPCFRRAANEVIKKWE